MPLADAAAELALLGCLMRDPTRLADRHITHALFVVPPHRQVLNALKGAQETGTLGGDLMTATAALEVARIPNPKSLAAAAFVAAEDVMPAPVLRHLTKLATKRTAADLAAAVNRIATSPDDPADDREALATLGAGVAELGSNGHRPAAWTDIDTVRDEEVTWLWTNRIAFGKVTILDGDPGLGKTAVAMDLAARVSRGLALPDDPEPPWPPAGVVIVNAEDGLGDTLRPRLRAAGADLARIAAFDLDHIPMLPTGLPVLRDALRATTASLLIIDPIMAVLSAATDAYRDHDVRLVLRPLAALAQELNVAVLMIRHLTKQPGPKALYRGGGSIAFSGVARGNLLVSPDPDSPDRRILASIKNNLGLTPPAIRFQLDSHPLSPHITPVRITWLDTTRITADELVAPAPADADAPAAVAEAMSLLASLLERGPVAADTAWKEARKLRISDYAWRRAKARLNVVAKKESFSGGWFYQLPD